MSIRKAPSQVGDLEESLAALSVLEENLKKTDLITQKMSTLLSTVFDARLGKLEENIKPMYNTTRNLTQISQSWLFWRELLMVDIDATIAAVDNMRKNFDIVPREEAIIKAGSVFTRTKLLTIDRSRIFRSIWEVLPDYRIHTTFSRDLIYALPTTFKHKWYLT